MKPIHERGRKVLRLAAVVSCAAACGLAQAKPVIPAAPERLTGEQGLSPVDLEAVHRAETDRHARIASAEARRAVYEKRQAQLAAAREALDKRDPKAALAGVEGLLKDDPKDADALRIKADAEALSIRLQSEAHSDRISALLAAADKAQSEGKWDEAAARYDEVLSLVPGHSKALKGKERIEQAKRDAASRSEREKREAEERAAREKAEQEKKAREEADRSAKEKAEADRKANEAKIAGFVSVGDAALEAGKFDEAEKAYSDALAMDAENRGAKRGIDKVSKARADAAARAEKEKAAAEKAAREAAEKAEKEKAEQERKAREEAERAAKEKAEAEQKAHEEQLKSILAAGEAALSAGNLDEAEGKFRQVIEDTKPKGPPWDSIVSKADRGMTRVSKARADAAAKAEREKVAAEKAAREAAEKAEQEKAAAEKAARDAQIAGFVSAGDAALEAGRYDEAEKAYNDALAMDQGNRSAKRGIDKVNKARADAAARAEKEKAAAEKAAREAAEKAEKEKAAAEKAARDAQIAGFVSAGDAALEAGRYDEAEKAFSDALAMDAGNRSAKRGIDKVSKARADAAARAEKEKAAAEKAAREAAEKAEKEKAEADRKANEAKIAGFVSVGDAALEAGRYDEAEKAFSDALAMDANNRSAKRGLDKVNKARADAAARAEREKAAAEKAAREAAEKAEKEKAAAEKAARDAQIAGFVSAGDEALSAGKFDEAEKAYNDALAMDAGNRSAKRGIDKVRKARADAAARAEKERLAAEKAAAELSRLAAIDTELSAIRGLMDGGDFQAALERAEAVLKQSPSSAQRSAAKELRDAAKAGLAGKK